jgi:thioredoxin reductase (NADPH)
VLFETEVVEIRGSDAVGSVRLKTDGAMRDEELAGVFIFVGLEPNTQFVQGVVDLDPAGHVIVDAHLQASVPGIFAAGDLRQYSSRQLVSAAGDGATAAISAARFLQSPHLS